MRGDEATAARAAASRRRQDALMERAVEGRGHAVSRRFRERMRQEALMNRVGRLGQAA